MMMLIFALLFVGAGLPAQTRADGKVRFFVPRADSPTAMRRCGSDLEDLKKLGKLQRYVFSGAERLTEMAFCGATGGIDRVHVYAVPAGTVGWLKPDGSGRIVLEECVNDALCKGCELPKPFVPSAPPPVEAPPPTPAVMLLPPPEPVALNDLPPAPAPWQQPEISVELLWEIGRKFPIPCYPRERGWYGTGLPIAECAAVGAIAWWLWPAAAVVGTKVPVPVITP